jgi:hypothetical protein
LLIADCFRLGHERFSFPIQARAERFDLLARIAKDADDHRDVEGRKLRQFLAQERVHADVLQAHGIEHASRRFDQPWRWIPMARREGERLGHDPAELGKSDVPAKLQPIRKRSCSNQDRVGKP